MTEAILAIEAEAGSLHHTQTGCKWCAVIAETARQQASGASLTNDRCVHHYGNLTYDCTCIADHRADGAQQERERLRTAFATYWDWLITQRAYGNGGGWGEAAMLKVSTLLAEPSDE